MIRIVRNQILYIILIGLSLSFLGCDTQKKKAAEQEQEAANEQISVFVPTFNADSAYYYVEKQVSFGPRVPNSQAHRKCASWLTKTLKRFTPDVVVQKYKSRAWDNTALSGQNIIGSFNTDKKVRVLLCAHWDSRPVADHDPDPENRDKPVPGANDGASGVGVLLEIARQLSMNSPEIGVDIIFFDLEDSGEPQSMQSNFRNTWGLGSQYWSRNPHILDYRAKYGILLDMVGARDAVFTKEGTSMYFAKTIVDKVWDIAHEIGYKEFFPVTPTQSIIDDHYYINDIAKIPTIDIIQFDGETKSGFFKDWHTIYDDMDNIDPETLGVVGQLVLTVVFREK